MSALTLPTTLLLPASIPSHPNPNPGPDTDRVGRRRHRSFTHPTIFHHSQPGLPPFSASGTRPPTLLPTLRSAIRHVRNAHDVRPQYQHQHQCSYHHHPRFVPFAAAPTGTRGSSCFPPPPSFRVSERRRETDVVGISAFGRYVSLIYCTKNAAPLCLL